MDERGYKLRSEVCSMSARDADKLIDCGDGDCALLYIYLMRRCQAPEDKLCRDLGMTRRQLDAAAGKLRRPCSRALARRIRCPNTPPRK